MKINRCSYLLEKFKKGLCTYSERAELMELITLPEMETFFNNEIEKQIFLAELKGDEFPDFLEKDEADSIYQSIVSANNFDFNKQEKDVPIRKINFRRYAAAILLIVSVGGFIIWKSFDIKTNDLVQQSNSNVLDIDPGGNGALLTLANGSTIVLDSLQDGVVAKENGSLAILRNGSLNYDSKDADKNLIGYNTITTPKGRQFNLVLSDGTRVWLNAGSSLQYPTAFRGKERRVTITGEAYFEVAHQPTLPFYVDILNQMEIKVLGTHFNVNAYVNEETINTTLLEGVVQVNIKNGKPGNYSPSVQLIPGQQARLNADQSIETLNKVQVDAVIAWKNGIFNFDDKGIEEVMRQLERWYNIEVIYENGVPDIEFWGKLEQNLSLSAVLRILERAEVQFKIVENRKLIVL